MRFRAALLSAQVGADEARFRSLRRLVGDHRRLSTMLIARMRTIVLQQQQQQPGSWCMDVMDVRTLPITDHLDIFLL